MHLSGNGHTPKYSVTGMIGAFTYCYVFATTIAQEIMSDQARVELFFKLYLLIVVSYKG